MQLGMVGLGRMGANMVRRLVRDGHECVVYDVSPRRRARGSRADGVTGAGSLDDFASDARSPTGVAMVPAGLINEVIPARPGRPIRARRHRSSTAATATTATTSAARRSSANGASTTSTSARAEACSAWSAASA